MTSCLNISESECLSMKCIHWMVLVQKMIYHGVKKLIKKIRASLMFFFEENGFWIKECGRDDYWLCRKMCSYNHLGFSSAFEVPSWGGSEVQRFGTVFWSWKIWQFDCDLQVMKYTPLWGRDVRYNSKHKRWGRKVASHWKPGLFGSLWRLISKKAKKNKNILFKRVFPGVRSLFSEEKKQGK